MSNTVDKIIDTTSDAINSISEIAKDRIFSPMYFYFIGSWTIINWKFVYTLLFVEEQTILGKVGVLKIDYLVSFYEWTSFFKAALSISELLILPLASAFVFVWFVTILSEVFFKRYEEHQSNKRIIKRGVEFREKVKGKKQDKEIQREEYNIEPKRDVQYEDNKEFNNYLDENAGVEVGGIVLQASEVLYKNDYEAYKSQLNAWIDEQVFAHTEHLSDIAKR